MAYSPEFRLEAAQLVVDQGYKIKADILYLLTNCKDRDILY
jgi:hypothetical protein